MTARNAERLKRLAVTAVLGILITWVISGAKEIWLWRDVWAGPNGRYLLLGLPVTLLVSGAAMVVGVVLGVAAGVGRLSPRVVPNQLATLYVEFVRGTPLLVQIYIAFYCVTLVVPLESRLLVGILALGTFSGAYIAEIIRAGVESVPRGQMEAARSLGMTHGQAMVRIIGPQALKNALPPLAGQFISLVKDSSLLMIIGVLELTKRAGEVKAATYSNFEILLPLAGLYLVLTYPLSRFTQWLEKRLGGDDRGHRI